MTTCASCGATVDWPADEAIEPMCLRCWDEAIDAEPTMVLIDLGSLTLLDAVAERLREADKRPVRAQ